jgi:hypothetical protein
VGLIFIFVEPDSGMGVSAEGDMAEYLHQAPGTEVRFIAGHYTIVEELRIAYHGREVLAVVGIAAVGSSCCGTQGCRFVNVPGTIVAWKGRLSESGVPVSIVKMVESEAEQAEIRQILEHRFPYSQILFPT